MLNCRRKNRVLAHHPVLPARETPMTTVTLQADIKAKWPQGQSSYSPGSPEELAIIGIDLLVKELGTQAAQAFIGQVFEKYPADHMGAHNPGRD